MTLGANLDNEAPLEWFEEAYATCPVASLVVDEQRRVVFINDAACHLLELSANASLSSPADIAVPDGNAEGLDRLIRRALRSESPLRVWKGRLNLPEPKPIEVRFTPLPGPSPYLLCRLLPYREMGTEMRIRLISSLADIPRTNEDFNTSGQRIIDAIYEHLKTPVAAIWEDETSRRRRWEAGDEAICREMTEKLDKLPAESKNAAAFCVDGARSTVQIVLEPREKSSVQLLIAGDAGERILHQPAPFWSCLATTAEASLRSAYLLEQNRQRRRRLRAVLEHMPMAVMIFDARGMVLELNLRGRAMSGRRDWVRVGADDHPFEVRDTDGRLLPREQWPFLRAVNTGEGCEEDEYVLDFGDIQRTVSVSIIPITDENDRITSYLATARDVTQRSEEERRKDEFLSVASHELRGPLTPLAGFIHLSRKQAEAGEPVDPSILNRASAQVERLQRLIDSLLDMSRLETGKLPIRRAEVDIKALVERIVAPWLNGPHSERFVLCLPEREFSGYVDPDRIDQVLTNVIDNSIRHGRPGGQVKVVLNHTDQDIQLAVCDEGDGMPQAVIDCVFDRYFFDQKSDSAGTGIGLYISRQIVEDHGGEITIDSGPGEPTTVTIRLPRQKP